VPNPLRNVCHGGLRPLASIDAQIDLSATDCRHYVMYNGRVASTGCTEPRLPGASATVPMGVLAAVLDANGGRSRGVQQHHVQHLQVQVQAQ
jgi:hypothetical protein